MPGRPTAKMAVLPRPARLGDFPEAAEHFSLPAVHGVHHLERTAFGENQMARIRSPNGIFARPDDPLAATARSITTT